MQLSLAFATLLQFAVLVFSTSVPNEPIQPTILDSPQFWYNTTVAGQIYSYKGLIAIGSLPADQLDNSTASKKSSLGAFGSGIAVIPGTYEAKADGSYYFEIITTEDRGENLNGTINFPHRKYRMGVDLRPYYGLDVLSPAAVKETLTLTLINTLFDYELDGVPVNALDANSIRPATFGYPYLPGSQPELPISSSLKEISMDAEGIAVYKDEFGNKIIYICDEYGPYLYQIKQTEGNGYITAVLAPPQAIIPSTNGVVNFTSETDPECGRISNTGFEGLSITYDGSLMFMCLQGATAQDGGSSKKTSRNTRLLKYQLGFGELPKLIAEYILQLPIEPDDKTKQTSEHHAINDLVALNLARDAYGFGDQGVITNSSYKNVGLTYIGNATNILGSKFDTCEYPAAPDGVLDSSITPAVYLDFINMLSGPNLARFGRTNATTTDGTGILDKYESIAIVPIGNCFGGEDYAVIVCADNDFETTHGYIEGVPYDAGDDVPNECMAFEVTLPGLNRFEIYSYLDIPCIL